MVAPLSHYGPTKYEAGLHITKKECLVVFVCVCVQRDVCRGWSGEKQIICESIPACGREIQICAGGVAGCCNGRPSGHLEGVFATMDWDKPTLF